MDSGLNHPQRNLILFFFSLVTLEMIFVLNRGLDGLKIICAANVLVVAILWNYESQLRRTIAILTIGLLPLSSPLQGLPVPGQVNQNAQALLLIVLSFIPGIRTVEEKEIRQKKEFRLIGITIFLIVGFSLIPNFPNSIGIWFKITALVLALNYLRKVKLNDLCDGIRKSTSFLSLATATNLLLSHNFAINFLGVGETSTQSENEFRFASGLQDFEMTSQLFTTFFLFQVFSLIGEKSANRLKMFFYSVASIASALVILVTGTRSGIFVMWISIAFVFLFKFKSLARNIFFWITFGIASYLFIANSPLAARLFRSSPDSSFADLLNRSSVWNFTLNRFDWPGYSIHGIGLPYEAGPGMPYPHSAYLFVWLVAGFPAFLLFVLLSLNIFVRAVQILARYKTFHARVAIPCLFLLVDGIKVEHFRKDSNTFVLILFCFMVMKLVSTKSSQKLYALR